jgi:hypothetical protein
LVDFGEYTRLFREHDRIANIDEYGTVVEGGREYPLLRALTTGRRTLVITSGFHGEEPAGPLSLLSALPELVEYARARDVGLCVYPCINPSGFEDGTRYNRSGERPNNDFLRYETSPGVWKGELDAGEPFLRWKLFDAGPKETRAVRADLEKLPAPDAALDIHQDRYVRGAFTYAYVFGDQAPYSRLTRASEAHAQVIRGEKVDERNHTNSEGLIEYNDGSVTDYFFRRGVPWAAALETTTHTPLEACHAVNLIWLRGFIDLAARGEADA